MCLLPWTRNETRTVKLILVRSYIYIIAYISVMLRTVGLRGPTRPEHRAIQFENCRTRIKTPCAIHGTTPNPKNRLFFRFFSRRRVCRNGSTTGWNEYNGKTNARVMFSSVVRWTSDDSFWQSYNNANEHLARSGSQIFFPSRHIVISCYKSAAGGSGPGNINVDPPPSTRFALELIIMLINQ